jgi:hypothetical protein
MLGGRTIGSTSDSGSDYPGSSPGLPANLFSELARSPAQIWEHLLFQPTDCLTLGFLDRLNVECERSLWR